MKNLSDVRKFVFTEIYELKSGKTDVQKLNAVIGALNFVLSTAKLELEYAKAFNKDPKMDFVEVNIDAGEQPQLEGK